METDFTKKIFQAFLKYQQTEGGKKTLKDFSDYLEWGKVSFNHAFNGRRPPSKKLIQHLADFYNDPTWYDVANMIRPDPRLEYIQRNWGKVPDNLQHQIAQMFSKYTTDPMPENGEHETPNL